MGTLIAMHYPTKLFANQADHTYVKCGTGKCAWSCWGGKTGGKVLRSGAGSTKRANCIAKPNERAGITCYLINGVCHQAANRILLPAGITVRGARGYSISEALFGTYGRVGFWPCRAPFDQCPSVTGDLPACKKTRSRATMGKAMLSETSKLEWQYIKGVLGMYGEAKTVMKARLVSVPEARSFHLGLFMYMAEFHLGPMLEKGLSKNLKHLRGATEKKRVKMEMAFSAKEMAPAEFADEFDKVTIEFQDEMANAMTAGQYETLFDLKRSERITLADRKIVSKAFRSKG